MDEVEKLAKELRQVGNFDTYCNGKDNLTISHTDYYKLARFVMRREIEARLETHKEYNNPTLTCNCLNHSNRRIAELRKYLKEVSNG